jgi:RNA 2',3'-cyclic 3'-phosphodiesterase
VRRRREERRHLLTVPRRPRSGAETWRVFTAIELPPHLRSLIQKHINNLRQAVPDSRASWSRPESIHLTLKFFGEVAVDRIPKISVAVAHALGTSPFEILVARSGVFPKVSDPRVLWIGVDDPTGKLSQLQQMVENECARNGFAKEDRAFRPHLTIARIRKPNGAPKVAQAHQQLDFQGVSVLVNELVVFRSELSSEGSKYTAISRHELSGEI